MSTRARILAAATLAAAGLASAGCGPTQSLRAASTSLPTAATSVPVASATSSAPVAPTGPNSTTGGPPPGGRVVTAGDTDNGHTITVAAGNEIEVRLTSTYWTFAANPSGPALRPVGSPRVSVAPIRPGGGCVPGGGCGTAIADYEAVTPGTAVISASRRTCGEAMACTTGHGSYRVTVIVTP